MEDVVWSAIKFRAAPGLLSSKKERRGISEGGCPSANVVVVASEGWDGKGNRANERRACVKRVYRGCACRR